MSKPSVATSAPANRSVLSTATTSRRGVRGPATTTLPWCCTASIEVVADSPGTDDINVLIERPDNFVEMSDWMRRIERAEGREMDAVGAGVYDTWRCDRVLLKPDDAPERSVMSFQTKWNQWGADFHLNRLSNSYRDALRLFAGETQGGDSASAELPASSSTHSIDDSSICQAISWSYRLVHEMLREADDRLSQLSDADNWPSRQGAKVSNEEVVFQLVRVTLLWSAPKVSTRSECPPSSNIVIRGHACCTGPIQDLYQPHEPISVSIAMNSSPVPSLSASEELSRANHHPHLKLAKWTRLRQEIPRPTGVGEVLLTGRGCGRLEILEGLSSNVFVVYENGTIRTAIDGVLHGYVRHLVLECVEECGLTFDPEPVWLEEPGDTPMPWSEVFITSSSRLIYPVSTILIPVERSTKEDGTPTNYREYWKCRSPPETPQKWQCLLDAILSRGGYST